LRRNGSSTTLSLPSTLDGFDHALHVGRGGHVRPRSSTVLSTWTSWSLQITTDAPPTANFRTAAQPIIQSAAGDDRYFSRELRHLHLPPLRTRSTFEHLCLKRETDVQRRGGGPTWHAKVSRSRSRASPPRGGDSFQSRPEPQFLLQLNGRLLGPDIEPEGNGVFVVLDNLVVPR
jgi:hypothetical protein